MRPVRRRAVLGIDAAWTASRPSGVALAVEDGGGWRLARVAGSYAAFCGDDAAGMLPDPEKLLRACECRPELVAVDMPLSRTPITGRRASDRAIATAFARAWCAPHSPSALRPGQISDRLTADFAAEGYELRTEGPAAPGLIEVYPHPALLALSGDARRLEYKQARAGRYWKGVEPAERRVRLVANWRRIAMLLDARIAGVADALPPPDSGARGVALKAHEDQLDAVVCAWVAICALEGRAVAHGDAESAIWVPRP